MLNIKRFVRIISKRNVHKCNSQAKLAESTYFILIYMFDFNFIIITIIAQNNMYNNRNFLFN